MCVSIDTIYGVSSTITMESFKLPDLHSKEEVQGYLRTLSHELGVQITDPEYAQKLDSLDHLTRFRERFRVPNVEELLEGCKKADGT